MDRAKQVGGSHYSRMAIQPVEFYEAIDSVHYEGFLRFNAIKYLSRYPQKGQIEDIKKAKHYCELLETLLRKRTELSQPTNIEDK